MDWQCKGRLLADSAPYAYQETGEGEIVLHDKSDVGEITLEQIRNRDGVLIAYDGRGASISMNAAAARGAEMEDDGYEMG